MISHPASDSDSYRRDFSIADPDSGQAGATVRVEAELAERFDHRVLETAQIAGHVAGVSFELQNWVTDQLPGTVIGHLAAARDAVGWHVGRIRDDKALVGAAAEGEDVLMLHQQERVANSF